MKKSIVIVFILALTLMTSSIAFANTTISPQLKKEIISKYGEKEAQNKEKEYLQLYSNSVGITAANPDYDRYYAVNYANTYWNNPNTNFPFFGDYGEGGDCANFVSQCLYYGHMSQIYGNWDINNENNWFCVPGVATDDDGDPNISLTWKLASAFQKRWRVQAEQYNIVGKYDMLNNFDTWYNDLWSGDVIQLCYSSGQAHHTMIVTGFDSTNRDILVTYHNAYGRNPEHNLSLKTIVGNLDYDRMVAIYEIKDSY